KIFRRLVLKDGVLTGFILIGDVAYAGVLTTMIRSREAVGPLAEEILDGGLERFAAGRARRAAQSRAAWGPPAIPA
ncbi:MAG: hypothetical protein C4534_02710, partial [Gaiellales bacterium]